MKKNKKLKFPESAIVAEHKGNVLGRAWLQGFATGVALSTLIAFSAAIIVALS